MFPFNRFPGVDPVLSPEMKSTGEVMGIDRDFAIAFAKSQLGAGTVLPVKGAVFVSVKDGDKPVILARGARPWSTSASASSRPAAPPITWPTRAFR